LCLELLDVLQNLLLVVNLASTISPHRGLRRRRQRGRQNPPGTYPCGGGAGCQARTPYNGLGEIYTEREGKRDIQIAVWRVLSRRDVCSARLREINKARDARRVGLSAGQIVCQIVREQRRTGCREGRCTPHGQPGQTGRLAELRRRECRRCCNGSARLAHKLHTTARCEATRIYPRGIAPPWLLQAERAAGAIVT
jgi:hypothetical protein